MTNVLRGKCHCGAVEFEVSARPEQVTRCTCTFCSKRGALWAYYKPEQFQLLKAGEGVAYSTNPKDHKHYHCANCGCSTFSDTPSYVSPDQPPVGRHVPVNARLFEDFDLDAVPVRVIDGRNLW